MRAGDSFTVSWSDVYGPTDPNGTYWVQLAGASDFAAASLLADQSGRNLTASFPTTPGAATTLFFRVTALAGCGTPGAFSATVAINVTPNPPSIVVTQAQSPEWVVPPGQLPPAATLVLKNVGGAATPVQFRAADGFFTLAPTTGVMQPGQEVTLTLTPLAGSTASAGSQAGNITADWTAASIASSVFLTVAGTTSSGSRPSVDQDEVLLVRPAGATAPTSRPRSLASSQSSVTITNTGAQPIFLVPSVEPGGAWLKLDPADFTSALPPGQTRVVRLASDPARIRPADYPLPIWTVLTIAAAGGASTDRVQVKVFYTEESAVVSGAGRGFLAGGARSFIVPTAVHKSGVGGALFTSDGWLRNLSPDPATFDVLVTPSGQDGQVNALKVTQTIPGFSTVRLFDFIQSLFGTTDLAGPVEIRSKDAAQLSLRTTANGLPGTGDASSRYGTEIVVYGAGTGTGVGLAPLVLTGLKDDAANRLNLILSETTGTAATVRLRLYDSSGSEIASQSVAVPAAGNIQFRLIQQLGIPNASFESGSLIVEPVAGAGRVVALGTVIDNVSQSFQGLTGRALASAASSVRTRSSPLASGPPPPRVIPSIVHAAGIGAFFVTELSITNGTNQPASIHLVYDYAGSISGRATADVTLGPRASLAPALARDAVVNLFGLSPGSSTAGSLRIEGPGLAQIVARATVTTPVSLSDSTKGTKGSEFQSFSLLSPEAVGLGGTRVAIYPGLQKYAGIRTNLILAEVSGQPVRVRLRAVNGATGGVLAEIERPLAAYERFQINDLWNGAGGFGIGPAALDKVSLSLEPIGTDPGRVVGALAVIDNVTNSSRILVMAPPGPPEPPTIGF